MQREESVSLRHSPLSPEEIRRAVYEEAKARFLSDGIAATEIKKIADATGIGRSTLYRYFPSKEQLAVFVAIEMIEQFLFADFVDQIDPSLDGYGKIRAFCGMYVARLQERPDLLRFFLEYDFLFSIGNADIPERRSYEDRLVSEIEAIASFLREGQADGSVRAGVDPIVFTIMFIHSAVGMAQRFLTRTVREGDRYGIDISALFDMQIELILRAIRP
jgi:AcrR family transcriptional regulator